MQIEISDSLLKTQHAQSPLYLLDSAPIQLELKEELRLANKRVRELEKSVKSLNFLLDPKNFSESLMYHCQQFLPKNLVLIVQYHLMSKNRKKKGFRYTKQMKDFALSIYYLSPKVYRYLQPKFSLPNMSTIKCAKLKY